ncbi:KGG domain-containing protein [Pseudoduganella guangdongensis]|nr:KGG domain-containing protein [Pseudoduganella guangdongensis]
MTTHDEQARGRRSKRGFAAMDKETQRMIASKGGQAAHQKGTAHEFTPDEARRAGQKGGEAVSRDREHMAEIGRKGGESRQTARNGNRQGGEPEAKPNPSQG